MTIESLDEISGIGAWYDASVSASVTTVGDNVTQVDDLSGNDRHLDDVVGTPKWGAGVRTHKGKTVLDFGGTDGLRTYFFTTYSQPNTVVCVGAFDSLTGQPVLFDGASGAEQQLAVNAAGTEWRMYAGNNTSENWTTNNEANVFVGVFNTTTSLLYINSTSSKNDSSVGDVGSHTLKRVTLGARAQTFSSSFLDGWIGEYAFWPSQLTTDQINDVIEHLSGKWMFDSSALTAESSDVSAIQTNIAIR